MTYWTVQKYHNGKWIYVSETDEYGYPIHTDKESEAWKFYDFNTAMSFFELGYIIMKH